MYATRGTRRRRWRASRLSLIHIFYKDGEMMNTGVDGATIADGEHYELVYTK